MGTAMKQWIDARREKMRVDKEKASRNPILGLRMWMKRLTLGIAVVILALAVAIFQQYVADAQRDEDRATEQIRSEQERIERAVEACFNYNEDQTNNRITLKELIPELAVNFFEATPEEAEELLNSPGGENFIEFIAERNPYRQCSIECVIAHTTPGAPRCEAAVNEQGDPDERSASEDS